MEHAPAKTVMTKAKDTSRFGVDYDMNIYRDYCRGCICYDSRSNCYQIDNSGTVRAEENAFRTIRDDLWWKVKPGVAGTNSVSDPYNPFEGEMQLTRHAPKLIGTFGSGVAIATKSTLMMHDMGILEGIKEHSPILCKVIIATADDTLSKKVEPHAACSSERFVMLGVLGNHGIYARVLLIPVLPFLEDPGEDMLAIVRRVYEAGARFIHPAFGMTLRNSQREWYFDKLNEILPS